MPAHIWKQFLRDRRCCICLGAAGDPDPARPSRVFDRTGALACEGACTEKVGALSLDDRGRVLRCDQVRARIRALWPVPLPAFEPPARPAPAPLPRQYSPPPSGSITLAEVRDALAQTGRDLRARRAAKPRSRGRLIGDALAGRDGSASELAWAVAVSAPPEATVAQLSQVLVPSLLGPSEPLLECLARLQILVAEWR